MIQDHPLLLLAFPLAGYLIGSTPFGVVIARSRGVDLRAVGSGNVGATNVGRALGRKWGYLCFLLDVLKGLLPVLVAGMLLRPGGGEVPSAPAQAAWIGTGCGVVVGHVLSFWLKFRGGKGVASSLGVVLGVWPYLTLPGLCALGIWVVVTLASRYVSLGSVVAAGAFVPLVAAWNHGHLAALWPMLTFCGVIVVLIVVRHRANIARLVRGTENRIASRKAPEAENQQRADG